MPAKDIERSLTFLAGKMIGRYNRLSQAQNGLDDEFSTKLAEINRLFEDRRRKLKEDWLSYNKEAKALNGYLLFNGAEPLPINESLEVMASPVTPTAKQRSSSSLNGHTEEVLQAAENILKEKGATLKLTDLAQALLANGHAIKRGAPSVALAPVLKRDGRFTLNARNNALWVSLTQR